MLKAQYVLKKLTKQLTLDEINNALDSEDEPEKSNLFF